MDTQEFPVEVYPLDQIRVPGLPAAVDWSAAIRRDDLSPDPAAHPVTLLLKETPEGHQLSAATVLGERALPVGTAVVLAPFDLAPSGVAVWSGGEALALLAAPGGGLLRTFGNPAAPPAGFARGTLIDTPNGPKPVETLGPGDLVSTLDNGSQPLVWVGRRDLVLAELLSDPALRPVHFASGATGNGMPLVVARGQRMLIDDWRAEVYFAEDRVLVAAQALIDDRLARLDLPRAGVEYRQLLCLRHEILIANGALTESFHPGEIGYAGLLPADRARAEAALPEAEIQRRRAACPIVRNTEARALRLPG